MSRFASSTESQKVAAAYESAKKAVSDGEHPTDALHKAVSEAGLGEAHADTIGHTLNQTIAASVQLGDDPHADFDTADVEEVKKRIKAPAADKGEAKPDAPKKGRKSHGARAAFSNNFADHVAPPKAHGSEKQASASLPQPPTAAEIRSARFNSRAVLEKSATALAAAERDMEEKVAALVSEYGLASSADRQQALYAMVGRDPQAAEDIIAHVESKGHDTQSDMSKTASLPETAGSAAMAAVAAVDAVSRWGDASEAHEWLQKSALFTEDAAEMAEGLGAAAIGAGVLNEGKGAEDSIGEQMSPEALLRMRGFKAVDELNKAMLFNPELSRYSPHEIVRAFNSTVQMNPSAVNNPYLLQSTMADRLARGGVADPMALANEQKMSLHGLERRKLEGEIASNAAKTKKELAMAAAGDRAGRETTMSKIREALGTGAEGLKKGIELGKKVITTPVDVAIDQYGRHSGRSAKKEKAEADLARPDEALVSALIKDADNFNDDIDIKELRVADLERQLDQIEGPGGANIPNLLPPQLDALEKMRKKHRAALSSLMLTAPTSQGGYGYDPADYIRYMKDPESVRGAALKGGEGFQRGIKRLREMEASGDPGYAGLRAALITRAAHEGLNPRTMGL